MPSHRLPLAESTSTRWLKPVQRLMGISGRRAIISLVGSSPVNSGVAWWVITRSNTDRSSLKKASASVPPVAVQSALCAVHRPPFNAAIHARLHLPSAREHLDLHRFADYGRGAEAVLSSPRRPAPARGLGLAWPERTRWSLFRR
jgi:hypothetical protein